jgi:hypothetical protein
MSIESAKSLTEAEIDPKLSMVSVCFAVSDPRRAPIDCETSLQPDRYKDVARVNSDDGDLQPIRCILNEVNMIGAGR